MAVSDPRVAAQVVAPGEEPDFYDDIGCLARDLAKRTLSPDAVVFVADHRTGEWVGAGGAVYVRVPGLATPMGSGIVAHASAASRDGDAAARAGQSLTLQDVFGPAGLPGGPR
jgi:copper chaperone NosL